MRFREKWGAIYDTLAGSQGGEIDRGTSRRGRVRRESGLKRDGTPSLFALSVRSGWHGGTGQSEDARPKSMPLSTRRSDARCAAGLVRDANTMIRVRMVVDRSTA